MTAINGTNCVLNIGGAEEDITDYILTDIDYESVKNNFVLLPLMDSLDLINGFETYYYIRFSEPLAIDSFEFDLILETNDSSIKFESLIQVSISRFGFDARLAISHNNNTIKVSEAIVEESISCRVLLDSQPVSVIKFYGFRYKTDDKDFRIPLHISRVRVSAIRETNDCIDRKVLTLTLIEKSDL
jgi:hypothetical protein